MELPESENVTSGQRVLKAPLALMFFFVLAVAIVITSLRILFPFLVPILMAAVIVTFSFPLYKRLEIRLKGRSAVSALLMLLAVFVVILVPAFILMLMLIQQATELFHMLQNVNVMTRLQSLHLGSHLEPLRRFIPGFDPASVKPEEIIMGIVRKIPGFVATHGAAFLGGIVGVVISFFLMLLAIYYFYVEGERLIVEVIYLSPLPDVYDRELLLKVKNVINATLRGQVLTALAQGAVTGIGLAIVGIPAPVLWGAVAVIFSLIPMIGAAAIWVPAAGYLLFQYSNGEAALWKVIFMIVWGVAIVSLVDNVIRPWAMKGGTEMPAVVLFFSILGGIQAFGFVGILVGPLVFVLLMSIIQIYKDMFGKSLESGKEKMAAEG
ncbi:MAG TPA: AI-2E family transporter [Thermoanaerobaculia bacterium]|nr:AI-2E family transporter [Thermoanaerobaculia bacterium]